MTFELDRDVPDAEARKWAMFCHLGGLVSLFMPIPFANVVIPFIVWSAKKNEHPYIDIQGREALNFQITLAILVLGASAIVGVLWWIYIGRLLVWVPYLVIIAQLGGTVVGAIRAYDGERFRYPLILRFV
jgi:uncharacterized Tic20 family protein